MIRIKESDAFMLLYIAVTIMRLCSLQKATRKTDKVRPEEIHVNELTDEGLKDLLLKYGLNAGPIVGETLLTSRANNKEKLFTGLIIQ